MKPKIGISRAAVPELLILTLIVAISNQRLEALLFGCFSNSCAYIANGVYLNGESLLSSDWFSSLPNQYYIFTQLSAMFAGYEYGFLALNLLNVLVHFCFVLTLYLFCIRDAKAISRWRRVMLILSISFLFSGWSSLVPSWGRIFLNGLSAGPGYQSVLLGYFQPSEASVLCMLSLPVFLARRIYLGFALLLSAILFHPHNFVMGCEILFGLGIFYWTTDREKLREVLILSVLLGLLAVGFIYAANPIQAGAHSLDSWEWLSQIMSTRTSHHFSASVLWSASSAVMLLVGLVSIPMNSRSENLLLGSTAAVALLLTSFAGFVGPTALVLMPWRIFSILAPLFTFFVVKGLIRFCSRRLTQAHAKWIAIGLAVAHLSVLGVATQLPPHYRGWNSHKKTAGYTSEYWEPQFADLIKGVRTLLDVQRGQLMVPIETSFRYESLRVRGQFPIYVDYKAIPTAPQGAKEWQRRIQVAKQVYDHLLGCELNEQVLQLLTRERIGYALLETSRIEDKNCSQFSRVYSGKRYIIVDLHSPKAEPGATGG